MIFLNECVPEDDGRAYVPHVWSAMKKCSRYTVVRLVGGGAVALTLALVFLPRELVYQGKALSYWLDQLLTTNRPKAELAFREFGTKSPPFLERRIRSNFRIWREGYR